MNIIVNNKWLIVNLVNQSKRKEKTVIFLYTYFLVCRLKKAENSKLRDKEEELRKSFTEKVRNEETRFREWEQQLIKERDRLNKDLESQHAHIKSLESELDNLYHHGRSGTMRR